MKIKFQISLVVLTVAALAYFDKIPLREISSKGNFIQYQDKPQKISIHVKIPQTSMRPSNQTRQPSAINPEVGPVAAQTLSSENQQDFSSHDDFKIENDIDLREDIQNDLLFLFSINQREKDFLLNEVRVTPEKYQQILNQKKLVQWQLSQAPQYAKTHGYLLQEVKKSILSKHIYWMQSTIGVGYYNRFQELSLAE